ncbi:MAG: hypothetical protein M1826_005852 [Phylliscum demangeonii]|nr:MAG: hypothetical protein M1826_005852 [Phylliscum demangeonii]
MMLPFAQWLPDMDLAFNLNDECRVAVPWADAQAMRRAGEKAGNLAIGKDTRWSQDRAAGWDPVDVDESAATVYFEDLQYNSSFKSYGTPLCPPGSRARQGQPWDAHVLCYSCARPHSHGPFIRNWTLAGDFCHQPDLSSLHGFFLSPSSFTGTRKLMPIFSQSKVHGYNDILYPSAWNYVDRVKYAPTKADPDSSFEKKQRTLLWRGSTTEGVSVVGTWKGMVRERLVHLANNFSSSDTVPLLVPTGQGSTGYRYRNTRLADLRGALDLDIGIVDVARCGDKDCVDQEETYGFKPPLNFQEHWKYKYLFDLDGAAFSGRFLPFLQSRSLPFKAALFREWSDSRLSAWLHFVPQDLRLHDVHSTLAYFAGLHSTIDGSKVKMEAHNDQAEFIAEQGRAWAAKVLRKEDMEIYTFRLLLEWGRLTDDRRDEIGFQM